MHSKGNMKSGDHSCSGVGEKTKPYSRVLGSYKCGKKDFSVYVQNMPKKARYIHCNPIFQCLECNTDNFQ